MTITLRPLSAGDHGVWEALWRQNLGHFRAGEAAFAAIPQLWRRLLAVDEPLRGWLILRDGAPGGLAHVVLRFHTFSSRPVGILEDLWIAQTARRQGLAEACVLHLAQQGRAQGWSRLEWETDDDNRPAQALYDRLAARVAVQRYKIDLA